MNYNCAIKYLDSLQSTNIKLGLERITAACATFGHPERKLPSVIVAGTNGKGSTCAFLESILRHHGLKVGLYTSPHFLDVRERIQINRKPIGKKEFAKLVERLCCHPRGSWDLGRVKGIPASAGMTKGFTYFEFLTLMAFLYFAEQKVDIAVLEVGLGGRFDATNVVTPRASVITRIGLDHQGYLGDTLGKIAFEKAGIIKDGVPVVTVDQQAEAMEVIREIADRKGSMLHVVSPQEVKYKLGLLGEHQNENAALAVRAGEVVVAELPPEADQPLADALPRCVGEGLRPLPKSWEPAEGLPYEVISTALATTRWPGRLEIVSKRPLVILDGAHNPNGAEALAKFLQNPPRPPFAKGGRLIVIFGAMADKDIAGIVRPLIPVVDEWVLTRPNMERAASTETIVNVIPAKAGIPLISQFPNVRTAIKKTLAAMSKNDTLIITGSLYMIAEAKMSGYF